MPIQRPRFKRLLAAILLTLTPLAFAAEQAAHVYIVHGYRATPDDHWFAWLKQRLEQTGATVSVVALPPSINPRPQQWQQALAEQIPHPDDHSWFVTHSLGSIALLEYLATRKNLSTIGGYVLVSGFNERLSNIPQLDSFIRPDLDYRKLVQLTHNRVVIAARNDVVVPHAISETLAKRLEARFVSLPQGGHFLAAEGFETFPRVFEELKKEMSAR
ncbi:serine hydrolase family protein [Pseudomonas syringae]|nr:serine hydrolase family protein [Pseudomonas syringae]MBD8788124.1 serine hydrolase family protein [Pseudomonas syringae]MBD8799677.1 serine hydrolase family protein [Pseudomonas syringae]MBD8812757.1 serine hydrolase family protein [Pseudomonas syringae]